MDYQDEGEGEAGREMVWLVGKKDMKDTSGQAQQELGKGLGGKDEREFGREDGSGGRNVGNREDWKVGGGWYSGCW